MTLRFDSLAITWPLTSLSGYGIYGTQIALQFFRRGGQKCVLTQEPSQITLPALTQTRLTPVLEQGRKIAALLRDNPGQVLNFDFPVLHGAGNDFCGFGGADRVNGKTNVGCVAMEHMSCRPEGIEYAKRYHKLIAISRWNEDYLNSLKLAPVHLCHQGIDTQLFHPSHKTGLWQDRFVIFSGGKFEFRKGQDIVLAAFKRFAAHHPEALLVAGWASIFALSHNTFAKAGHIKSVPPIEKGSVAYDGWLQSEGLRADQFVALPYMYNMLTPSILWECDAAIFPNRCEGGTNLVAMEAAACGVPTYVSNNTGQRDLISDLGFGAFTQQKPVQLPPDHPSVEGWGETDVDEVVAALEKIYADPPAARAKALQTAERIKVWDWAKQNDKFLDVIAA